MTEFTLNFLSKVPNQYLYSVITTVQVHSWYPLIFINQIRRHP